MSTDGRTSPLPGEENHANPHVSASKWRHQESSSFAKHAQHLVPASARETDSSSKTSDLADFLNTTRVETANGGHGGGNYQPVMIAAGHAEGNENQHDAPQDIAVVENADGKEIACGPLLNYRRMEQGRWFGSVLVVVNGGGHDILFQPSLTLRRVGAVGQSEDVKGPAEGTRFNSLRLYSDLRVTFWAFDIDLPMEQTEVKYEYSIPDLRFGSDHKPKVNNFFVPALSESMRVMFHSCNGFSVGTDEDAWSGAALWNDVIRKHEERPYHVMVGGGDQIYNDGIRVSGPLRPWTDIQNPQKRRDYPFPEKLRAECDDYYLKNYLRWFNTEPFSTANGQIPQLNIWDDHDVSPIFCLVLAVPTYNA